MTAEAIKQSKITASPNTSAVLKKLGLYDKDFAIGSSYIDIGSLIKRNTTPFEGGIMKDVRDANPTNLFVPTAESIPGWIIRGVIREDDNTEETKPGTPEGDEPGGVFKRVYGHFYDPVINRGLTVGVEVGAKSVDWATDNNATANGRKNYYNVSAAREAMWRALTLKEWNNGTPTDATFPGNWPNSTKTQLRDAYWATMFRAVGDIVHLLQDAAQPQHTRNDAHAGLGCVSWTGGCAAGHASFFENYLKARTLRTGQFRLREGFINLPAENETPVINTTAPQLDYCCYTPPTFTKYADYFSTGTGGGNANGRGMANYSNRGFFSAGTNIGTSGQLNYPLPDPGVLVDSTITGNDVVDLSKNVVGDATTSITFKKGSVIDAIGGTVESNVKLSTLGVFDQFLIEKNFVPRYTLNHYNYDDQARLLIPRAVGYSAGLIDYFFRGQMEISLPDDGIYAIADHGVPEVYTKDTGGFKKLKLKLTNRTPNIVESGTGTISEQKLEATGKVVAVVKFVRNKCYKADDLKGEWAYLEKIGQTGQQILDACYFVDGQTPDEEIVVSDPVQLGTTLAKDVTSNDLTFNFQTAVPINAVNVYLQIVYRGKLGDEQDAVVVETRDISEPSFIDFSIDLDYQAIYTDSTCTMFSYARATGSVPSAGGILFISQVYFNQRYPESKIATIPLLSGQRSRLVVLTNAETAFAYVTGNTQQNFGVSDAEFTSISQVQNNDNGSLSLSILPKALWSELRGIFGNAGIIFPYYPSYVNGIGRTQCPNFPGLPGDQIRFLPPYEQPNPKPIPEANIVF